jgi:hypothetical protein
MGSGGAQPPGNDRLRRGRAGFGSVPGMIAAEVWHWWIGVVLFVVGVLGVVAVVAGYLKNVTAQRYPPRRARDD